MKLTFFLVIDGDVDSRSLWDEVKPMNANVVDIGKEVIVHGEISPMELSSVIEVCSRYGQLDGEIHIRRR